MSDNDHAEEASRNDAGKGTSRKRGTGFPVVALAEAAQILKGAGKYGFEHTTEAFAAYMGHSTTKSGSFRQRLAALRDWKLIAGRGEVLSMTEDAQIIAFPPSEDAEKEALQRAFHSCAVFEQLYSQIAKGEPLNPDHIGRKAIHELGISPRQATKFGRSFADSAVAAGLAEEGDGDTVVLRAVLDGAEPETASSEATEEPQTRTGAPLPVGNTPETNAAAPVVRQLWPIGGGEIVFELHSARALPADAFAAIGEVVVKLEALAGSLRGEQHADHTEVDHVEDEIEP